jgi:hypothetical protein
MHTIVVRNTSFAEEPHHYLTTTTNTTTIVVGWEGGVGARPFRGLSSCTMAPTDYCRAILIVVFHHSSHPPLQLLHACSGQCTCTCTTHPLAREQVGVAYVGAEHKQVTTGSGTSGLRHQPVHSSEMDEYSSDDFESTGSDGGASSSACAFDDARIVLRCNLYVH